MLRFCLLIFLTLCLHYVQNQTSRGTTEKVVEFVPNIYDPLINPNDKTYYNPNHGYEPYWPQGEWLIQDPDEGTNKSTTKIPTVCGEECNYLYMKIGPVCAHRSDNVFWEGCWYLVETFAFGYCDGHRLDDRMKGYTTFDTYCQYLDAKCKAPENTKYGLVHFGKCLEDQNLIYKKVHAATDVMSRMSGYLASLKVAMQNLNVDIV